MSKFNAKIKWKKNSFQFQICSIETMTGSNVNLDKRIIFETTFKIETNKLKTTKKQQQLNNIKRNKKNK